MAENGDPITLKCVLYFQLMLLGLILIKLLLGVIERKGPSIIASFESVDVQGG